MKVRKLLTGKEAEAYFRVQGQTLRLWDKKGQIETERTPGNTRRYVIYIDVPDPENPTEKELQEELAAKRKSIKDQLKRLRKVEDTESMHGKYAAIQIKNFEQELKELK